MYMDTNSEAIAKTLELLTDRFDAGELKPRQFEMVVRELMRTIMYARARASHTNGSEQAAGLRVDQQVGF